MAIVIFLDTDFDPKQAIVGGDEVDVDPITPDAADPEIRAFEAVNLVFMKAAAKAAKYSDRTEAKKNFRKGDLPTYRQYGMRAANETWTTFGEMFTADNSNNNSPRVGEVRRVLQNNKYLMDSWLEIFNPSDDVEDYLRNSSLYDYS